MKAESVIHIGYHKAASTYLQWRIFPKLPVNCAFLAEYKPQILDFAASGKAFEKELFQWVQEEITRKYIPPHKLTLISLEDLSGHAYGRKINDPFVIADTLQRATDKLRSEGLRVSVTTRAVLSCVSCESCQRNA